MSPEKCPYRVLVTGSRDWPDRAAVRRELDRIGFAIGFDGMTVVHGACPTGADHYADEWVKDNSDLGVRVERHPALWQDGRAAGPRRNRHMVSLGADVCLAFLGPCTRDGCRIAGTHSSHGAGGCAGLADAAGIPVLVKRCYVGTQRGRANMARQRVTDIFANMAG